LFCKVQIYIICHVMAMHICYVWKTSCYSLLAVGQATHQHMAGRQGGRCVNISIFPFLLSSYLKFHSLHDISWLECIISLLCM
jgi:hypothetical protein